MPADKPLKTPRRWVAVYAWVLTAMIFILVVMGGNVTSTNAGMAFEDWPTSAGHNMLLTPFDVWWKTQDKFAEHSHRLMGALVGFLSIGLVAWLWIGYGRGGKTWRRVCGVGTLLLVLVIIQGLLGGLRVVDRSQFFAFIHGILGQLVLACAVVCASVVSHKLAREREEASLMHHEDQTPQDKQTSPATHSQSLEAPQTPANQGRAHVRRFLWLMVGIFMIQLVLGSGVRHSGSAVAIPDFPTSYGRIIPPITQAGLNRAMAERGMASDPNAPGHYQLWQVWLHFSHRLGAVAVCIITAIALWQLYKRLDWADVLILPSVLLVSLLLVQVILGITTVLSQERPSIATLHQTVGALLLATVTWLTVRVYFVRSGPAPSPIGHPA